MLRALKAGSPPSPRWSLYICLNFMYQVVLENKQRQINNSQKHNFYKNNNLTSYMFRVAG